MKDVIVERDSSDGLHRREWTFCLVSDFSGCRIHLWQYRDMMRPTRRHKWQVIGGYGYRDSLTGRTRKDPYPLPDDVTREALNRFCRQISDAMDRFRGEHAAAMTEQSEGAENV